MLNKEYITPAGKDTGQRCNSQAISGAVVMAMNKEILQRMVDSTPCFPVTYRSDRQRSTGSSRWNSDRPVAAAQYWEIRCCYGRAWPVVAKPKRFLLFDDTSRHTTLGRGEQNPQDSAAGAARDLPGARLNRQLQQPVRQRAGNVQKTRTAEFGERLRNGDRRYCLRYCCFRDTIHRIGICREQLIAAERILPFAHRAIIIYELRTLNAIKGPMVHLSEMAQDRRTCCRFAGQRSCSFPPSHKHWNCACRSRRSCCRRWDRADAFKHTDKEVSRTIVHDGMWHHLCWKLCRKYRHGIPSNGVFMPNARRFNNGGSIAEKERKPAIAEIPQESSRHWCTGCHCYWQWRHHDD